MHAVRTFSNDPLKILRLLRHMSKSGVSASQEISHAIHTSAGLLRGIGGEPVRRELCALLCGAGVLQVLLEYSDVICAIIPELEPCIGFEQNNRYHQYTVYEHIAHAVANDQGNDPIIKVTLLLHDIGKPVCYVEDEYGGHFPQHGAASRKLAGAVLDRLDFAEEGAADADWLP